MKLLEEKDVRDILNRLRYTFDVTLASLDEEGVDLLVPILTMQLNRLIRRPNA